MFVHDGKSTDPVTVEKLHALLVPTVDRMQVDEALQALQRRSLLERSMTETRDGEPGRYTLHSVVLEYVTELLVEQVSEQILNFISPEPKASHLIPLGNDAGASTAAQSAERISSAQPSFPLCHHVRTTKRTSCTTHRSFSI